MAFTSLASDLAANDTNGNYDVFVRDLQLGTTTLISVNRFGTASGNGGSGAPVISQDGRFVAFTSSAEDLAAIDTNFAGDVFVRDLQLGTTTLVSINRFGSSSGVAASGGPIISQDGRFVVFTSSAADLAANDTNGASDVFVRDLQLGTTTLVSINRLGTESGNGYSQQVVSSSDGRFLGFSSVASDLVVTPDTNEGEDVFVRPIAP